MSFRQFLRRHIIVAACLVLIGFGIVMYIYTACPQKIGQPLGADAEFAFAPVFNEDGSAFHAKLDIGYIRGLLIVEAVLCMACNYMLYKIVLYYSIFFKMSRSWIYFVDFGWAAAVARLLMHLTGQYVLDYVYIRAGHATYDFFDFCIGICIVGIVLWMIPYCMKYHVYKKAETRGMHFGQKFLWEMRFGIGMLKMTFRPTKSWWKDVY